MDQNSGLEQSRRLQWGQLFSREVSLSFEGFGGCKVEAMVGKGRSQDSHFGDAPRCLA